jgi:hypothetical protein
MAPDSWERNMKKKFPMWGDIKHLIKVEGAQARHNALEPEPEGIEELLWVGCKVSRQYYRTLKEALIASQHAQVEAARKWDLGFDFGNQSPGEIIKHEDSVSTRSSVTEGKVYKGTVYQVTFP